MNDLPRLEAIEIKLAHLERSLQELGATVMRQQREIELLSTHNRALQEQLELMEPSAANPAGFEKPPHY